MNNKELLKTIGEADDKFVEEASYQEKTAQEGKVVPFRKWSWKKWTGAVAAVLVICIVAGFGLPSGTKNAPGQSASYLKGGESTEASYNNSSLFGGNVKAGNGWYEGTEGNSLEFQYDEKGEADSSELKEPATWNKAENSNLKMIYTAYLTLQTTAFDETEQKIKAAVEAMGGYFESMEKNNGSYFSAGSSVSSKYVVRVPSDKYNEFISGVGSICHVQQISHDVKNVGEEYFELENRLETLRIKLDRLQELLKKADNMADIITLESSITDTEYQINRYQTNLNRYDSLIDYSTVNITLYGVTRVDDGIVEDNSFLARLGRSFKRGWNSFIDSLSSISFALAENIFGIVILLAALFCLIRFRLISRLWKKIRKK